MIDIDEINPPLMYKKSYINIINQNIWYYDNINAISRCMTFIPNIPDYKFNIYHCLGALSVLFEYQYLLQETQAQARIQLLDIHKLCLMLMVCYRHFLVILRMLKM